MANGRVLTGFSLPYVALYASSGTTITYSSGTILARGVSVSLEVDSANADNVFYADNVAAESVGGKFTGGTATLTVDGLLQESEQLLLGLPAADGDGFVAYGSGNNIPYVGIGFICRYMSGGAESYVPVILTKCRASQPNLSASTQGEEIDWQTQEISFKMMVDDSADRNWKMVGTAVSTEALAEAKIKTYLSVS